MWFWTPIACHSSGKRFGDFRQKLATVLEAIATIIFALKCCSFWSQSQAHFSHFLGCGNDFKIIALTPGSSTKMWQEGWSA
jgi:hypothetical protein